jgi:hypothetical protein
MDKVKYKTIDAKSLKEFDDTLNQMVSEDWAPIWNLVTYIDNKSHAHFLMTMMYCHPPKQ